MKTLAIQSYVDALAFAALIGFGYLAMTTINTGINPNIPRPLFYGLLSGSYFFCFSLLSCSILYWLS